MGGFDLDRLQLRSRTQNQMFDVRVLNVFGIVQFLSQSALFLLGEVKVNLAEGCANVRSPHHARAEFDLARHEAETLNRMDPTSPQSMTLYADALWSSGLFQEAETLYEKALAAAPSLARGHHGMAKALAAAGASVVVADTTTPLELTVAPYPISARLSIST